MTQLTLTISQIVKGMLRFEWTTGKEIMIIRIESIDQAAYIVPVLPSTCMTSATEQPSEVWTKAMKFVLNMKVDLSSFVFYY